MLRIGRQHATYSACATWNSDRATSRREEFVGGPAHAFDDPFAAGLFDALDEEALGGQALVATPDVAVTLSRLQYPRAVAFANRTAHAE